MKSLLVAAVIMASLVGTQMIAEAGGGAGKSASMRSSSASMTRMGGSSMGQSGSTLRTRTQTQTRLRDQSKLGDPSMSGTSTDKLQTRQQLRDPALHPETITTPVVESVN